MATSSSTSGEWLKGALQELRGRTGSGLELDGDLISGLVSFCELAPPPDAADYLANIVGVEAAQDLIQEYLQRRGYIDPSKGTGSSQLASLQPYVKPSADAATAQTKKQTRTQKDPASSSSQSSKSQSDTADPQAVSKRGPKKKGGKAISLAEAAKGSVVFKQGKPCSCQARQHNLVSNCLSCGKIVCEQEGEGPCSFCGALVLMEGSTYAGLTDAGVPSSETEAAAEAYAKRLVDYDRNSAARTKVYDDQSDYFEMEGNSWLSSKEKSDLKKVHDEAQDAAEKQKGKVTVTFDLVGRKVILNKDEEAEAESGQGIMRPLEQKHQTQRIQPSPTTRDVFGEVIQFAPLGWLSMFSSGGALDDSIASTVCSLASSHRNSDQMPRARAVQLYSSPGSALCRVDAHKVEFSYSDDVPLAFGGLGAGYRRKTPISGGRIQVHSPTTQHSQKH